MSPVSAPAQLVASKRILVCIGSGGVGKTTVSAALALGAARQGRRALVLTIDPARRLADALGIEELGNEPRQVSRETLARLGVGGPGELHAMMLDMKRTFDDLVRRFAQDAATRERILGNPIYQHVSDALAGSAEYSAMEKVYQLSEDARFDLIVVDTPPSQHALDFLDAPQRLLEFLDSRIVKLLLHPAFSAGRLGFKMFQRGTLRVLRIMERVSGMGFLEDVSEFLLAFEGMSEGFRERAAGVRRLLTGPRSAFVLAAGPASETVTHARSFLERLDAARLDVAGIVLNRVRVWPDGGEAPSRVPDADPAAARAALARAIEAVEGADFPSQDAADAAIAAVQSYASLVRRDAEAVAPLREHARARSLFWRRVPELAQDVHDLEGLARIADFVFRGEQEGSRVGPV
jgi:anion-transporting  ArsA/GET3 family ATPase